ncbi:MAG: F0F1 ATP synthase subunit A [Candidatus Goldiibacteriota bacterium]
MGESLHFQSQVPFLDNHAFAIVVMMILDWLIVIGIIAFGTRNIKMKPKGSQNLVEWVVTYITTYADNLIGPKAPRYYPLLLMLFFYILVGNLMGLVPGLLSPTSMLSNTVALAAVVFITEHYEGIKDKGVVKYFKHFMGPGTLPAWIRPFIFFVELVSELSRPVSLSFRLFGNIMAKEILLGVLIVLVTMFYPPSLFLQLQPPASGVDGFLAGFSFILRPLIIILGTLFSIVQAGVFTLLTALYIAGAVAAHEEGDSAH